MHRWIAIAAFAAACESARAAPSGTEPSHDLEPGALEVLERHCRPCHTGPESSGGFDILELPGLRSGG